MRAASSQLLAILAGQEFKRCNLYTMKLKSGTTYYWTDAEVDVTPRLTGITHSSSDANFKNFRYKLSRGLSIDEFDIDVLTNSSDLIAGTNWNIAAITGALDYATLKVDRAFLPDWGEEAETVDSIFNGYVSDTALDEIVVKLHVVSNADKFNVQLPRILFQPTCVRTLGDEGCTVNLSSYSTTTTVTQSLNRYSFSASSVSSADGYFALGKVTFTSGNNSGVIRSIKSFTNSGSLFTLSYPLDYDLLIGDTFTVTAGCDKTLGSNGCAKFSNQSNFLGFPYVPNPESVTS